MVGENVMHPKLPEDLLVEVFLRSSVDSLVRARCVCQRWYALIRSQKFILSHLQYQKIHKKGRFLLQYFKEETEEFYYALFDDGTPVSDTYHDIDHFTLCNYSLHMEGPVNGLYCLFNGEGRIALWNPTLIEVKALPLPYPPFFPDLMVSYGIIGFGIDPLTDAYKFVLIRKYDEEACPRPGICVTVYNTSTNIWKLLNLGNFHLLDREFICESETSLFLSRTYYWWTCCGRVIAFDMGDETFRPMLGPDLPKSDSLIGSLAIYDDKVALILPDRNEVSLNIWVMLEEGVWIKKSSITSLPSFIFIVGLWNNDGLLVAIDSFETTEISSNFQTVLYDTNTQQMKNLGPRGMPISFRVCTYYESLVTLNCGSEQKAKSASLATLSDFLDTHTNPCLDLYDQI